MTANPVNPLDPCHYAVVVIDEVLVTCVVDQQRRSLFCTTYTYRPTPSTTRTQYILGYDVSGD